MAVAALVAFADIDRVAAEPATAAVTLQIRRLHMGDLGTLLLVPLMVQGEVSWWVLDTGSTTNVVSRSAAQRWRLADRGSTAVAAATGATRMQRIELAPLQARSLTWKGQTAVVADLDAYFAPVGASIDGILGMPVLGAQPVQFDLRRDRFTFAPTQDAAASQSATVLPLTMDGGLPVLELAVGERSPDRFLFDTGHAGSMVIFGARADASFRRAVEETTASVFNELGGALKAAHVMLPRVSAPGFEQTMVPAAIELGEEHSRGRQLARVAGVVGVALFPDGALTLDAARRQLVVDRVVGPHEIAGGFGMSLASVDGAIVVDGVFARGPAARAGITPGDRIVQLDGRDVFATTSEVWAHLAGSTEIRVSVKRDGETRMLLLRREKFFPALR